jgi:hypothetical protein
MSPQDDVAGDAAVWHLAAAESLSAASDSFTAVVTRLGCSGGVTGEVYEPDIAIGDSDIVVTFSVEPVDGGECPSNDEVPFVINIGEPIGERRLVDGACLDEGEAASTSFCEAGPERWSPPACATAPTASDAAVAALADRVLNAPIHAVVDRLTFDLEMVERSGIELHLVQIRSVGQEENVPLDMIPGAEEGDPPTNSFAGNSAFTSGAVLEVEDRSGMSTITLTLGAGGPDVLDPPVLEETDAELLADLCAAVATYPGDEDRLMFGNPELIAIGLSEADPAHAVTPAFAELVKSSTTMADLATAR